MMYVFREWKIARRSVFVGLPALACFGILLFAMNTFTQAEESFFIGNFTDRALTIDVPNIGSILGETDIEVRHPFWVSRRPADAEQADPTDLAAIADAWLTESYTNMRTSDGTLIEGEGISPDIVSENPEDESEDLQLDLAFELLKEQIARGG